VKGILLKQNANGWIQIGIVFYDPPCFKLKREHVSKYDIIGTHTEIIEFTHPKFHYQKFREIIGTEKDNPEMLEGYIQD
jgi:hypothetical protein